MLITEKYMANIGFVGLGHMGFPMAINLLKAGHSVMGYDLQQSALEHFAEQGGAIAHNLQELAKGKDVIVTMLQTGQQVLHVCLGVDGIFSQLNAGSLYIDCSTIDVKSSRETHQIAKENHLLVVDAPVSGGVAGAAAATLTFMVGGEAEAYNAAHPILSAMGKKSSIQAVQAVGKRPKFAIT